MGHPLISGGTRIAWRAAQTAVWLVGAAILAALLFAPSLGLHAFWNVLIPVAPALVAFAPGVWRNICPLGTTALLSRHAGLSRRLRLSLEWQARLALIGVVLLLAIVPLRHVVLDTSGPATALTIGALAAIAIAMGFLFEWKSGWCSGLCPVHPVEKLYGSEPALSVPNAHCGACERCVAPCPDSTPGVHPLMGNGGLSRRLAGLMMVGGFPGFIWGWFHVPDYAGTQGWQHLGTAYGLPFAGLAVTLAAYVMLQRIVPSRHRLRLVRSFAAAAIACYYWYRVPALFGFGLDGFAKDGMLVDLTGVLPTWFPTASRIATTALFVWWLVGRTRANRAWGVRPEFAEA